MKNNRYKNLKITVFCFLFTFFCTQLSAFTSELPKHEIAKKEEDKKQENKKEEEKAKKKKDPFIESEYEPVLIGALLEKPTLFINKKIKFRGRFSSFSNLALDYKPALRESKDFISICIFRPDSGIPLSELKLAYPVEEAKENETIRELEEGDMLEIYGEVFSAALDEPWVDIIEIRALEKKSKDKEKIAKDEDNEEELKNNEKKK